MNGVKTTLRKPVAPSRGRTGREPPGSPARRIAAAAVAEVLTRRVTLEEALASASQGDPIAPQDAALARAIATTTFRRFGTIREALRTRLAKGLPKDTPLLALLATGAAQILFMEVPDHATVDLAVGLARRDNQTAHLSGLVNAVLRRIAREREAITADADPFRDTPDWLARRWTATFGEATAQAIAAAHREPAAIDISTIGDAAEWAPRLGGHLLPTGSIRLADRTAIRDLDGYSEGAWWVQDAAAALPARLLNARSGERVADLCAAPGGKTAELARAGAHVVAIDRSAQRLVRLRENMARLRLEVEIRATDALTLDDGPFDAVLLDAPCTATGTLRRHPDAAWTKRETDIGTLADLQRRLLDTAASLVRPGGRLVYCTCSLEPEEGESQAEAFLERQPDFVRVPIDPQEVGGRAELIDARGDLRTLPCHFDDLPGGKPGLDGFFALRVSRRGA